VKIVSEMLGHSSVSFTLDRYSHVIPTIQREAARVMTNSSVASPASFPLAERRYEGALMRARGRPPGR
jgi:hypothetical protein